MTINRIQYRLWQFFSMTLGSFRPVDITYVKARLPSKSLVKLFTRMPRMEQNHAIAVSKALEREGNPSPDLLIAALLHDVGKIKHFPQLWERVFTVLVSSGAPRLASKMAQGQPDGLWRGLVVHRLHAEWGADLADSAGASSRTIFLIQSHHSAPEEDEELLALQSVDDN